LIEPSRVARIGRGRLILDHDQSFGTSLGRSRIGRYEVIYPIAQGGMAEVYAGRLSGMAGFEKLVAIKVVHPYLTSEQEFVEMFLDEARLAARIHHPNVAEIYEVGEDEGMYFMVGELVLGQNLRTIFRRASKRGVDVSHAVSAHIAAQAGRGLHQAHELEDQDGRPLKLVHRDMSLRNILVSYDGFVKLIDFGVAWAEGRISQTKVGTVKGKIGLMSPEQILGEPLDRRSDIFSIGVVIYMLVTGAQPFPGASDAERMHKIQTTDPVRPREINPGVSPALEEIILRALAKSPALRHPTAAALSEELEAYVRSTDEDVGVKALSGLLRDLFDDEISAHHEQLRSYRHERPDRPYAAFSGLSSPSAADDGGSAAADATSAARPSAKKRQDRAGSSRFRLAVVAAAVGVAALAVGAVLLAIGGEEAAPSDEPGPPPQTERVLQRGSAPAAVPEPPARDSSEPARENAEKVRIALEISPRDAQLVLDGEPLPVGTDRLELPDDGTSHTVEAAAAGFSKAKKTFVAKPGLRLQLKLRPRGNKSKPAKAKAGKMDEDLDLIHSPYR
jgi:serine/threonine-protein kinase